MLCFAAVQPLLTTSAASVTARRVVLQLAANGNRYAYRLSEKGTKAALLFVLFHKQFRGPLAKSLFHHCPTVASLPQSKRTLIVLVRCTAK